MKKTAKKLVLHRETLSQLESLEGIAGGATTLCTLTREQTCNCPTIAPPCHTY
jgi:hypothetical protein